MIVWVIDMISLKKFDKKEFMPYMNIAKSLLIATRLIYIYMLITFIIRFLIYLNMKMEKKRINRKIISQYQYYLQEIFYMDILNLYNYMNMCKKNNLWILNSLI